MEGGRVMLTRGRGMRKIRLVKPIVGRSWTDKFQDTVAEILLLYAPGGCMKECLGW